MSWVAPTEAGRRLADHARRLLADYGETVRAGGADEPLKGLLRLTAPVVFGRRHVMPLVTAFLRIYPHIQVKAVFSDANLDLIEEELDVAVRIGPLADSALVARRVGAVSRMLVASPAYLREWGVPAKVEDLARHDTIFTMIRPVPVEWRLVESGRERVAHLAPRLVVNQVEAALEAAREGLGIARALSYQVAEDIAAGRLVRLLPQAEPPLLPVQLVMSGGRHMPARTRAFVDFAATGLKAAAAIQPVTEQVHPGPDERIGHRPR